MLSIQGTLNGYRVLLRKIAKLIETYNRRGSLYHFSFVAHWLSFAKTVSTGRVETGFGTGFFLCRFFR